MRLAHDTREGIIWIEILTHSNAKFAFNTELCCQSARWIFKLKAYHRSWDLNVFDKFGKAALNLCMHVCTAEQLAPKCQKCIEHDWHPRSCEHAHQCHFNFRKNNVLVFFLFTSDTNKHKQGCTECTKARRREYSGFKVVKRLKLLVQT